MATKTTKTNKTNKTKFDSNAMVIVALNVIDFDNNRMLKRYIRKNGIAFHAQNQSIINHNTLVFIGAFEHIENMIHWFFNNASLVERVNAIAC